MCLPKPSKLGNCSMLSNVMVAGGQSNASSVVVGSSVEDISADEEFAMQLSLQDTPNSSTISVFGFDENEVIDITGEQSEESDGNFSHLMVGAPSIDNGGYQTPCDGVGDAVCQSAVVIGTIKVYVRMDIRRSNVVGDLMNQIAFVEINESTEYQIRLISDDGKQVTETPDEVIVLEVVAEFWAWFYKTTTIGDIGKLPCLRHDFGKFEWSVIGKIWAFGWIQAKYLPIRLALPFTEVCLFEDCETDVVRGFLNFLPEVDREILELALQKKSCDECELQSILNVFEPRVTITLGNVQQLLSEIAHKELIQKSGFVTALFKSYAPAMNINRAQLMSIYEKYPPSARKVMKSVGLPSSMNREEECAAKHLMDSIKQFNSDQSCRFMRACTGADAMIRGVEAKFDATSKSFGVCSSSCILSVPTCYTNFPQFNVELMKVLG